MGTLAVILKHMKQFKIIILLFCFFNSLQAQKKFKIDTKETETWRSIHLIKDEKGNLDSQEIERIINRRIFGIDEMEQRKSWDEIAELAVFFKVVVTIDRFKRPVFLTL